MSSNSNISRVKLYKAGKRWIAALLISGSVVGIGTAGNQVSHQVNAATPQAKQTASSKSATAFSTSVQKKTFSTYSAANNYVRSIVNPATKGPNVVNVGNNIKGTQGAAMGSVYTNWKEQGYNIQTQSPNNGVDSEKAFNEDIASQLKPGTSLSYNLPKLNSANENGAISLQEPPSAGDLHQTNIVAIQHGNSVYKVTSQSPEAAVAKAASLKI